MKKLFVVFALAFTIHATAQIKKVTLQASGLTCSMCSKAIYSALQKLNLAKEITSNIKESSYALSFNDDSKVDFDAIRKAVENAGFSVVKMDVTANFQSISIDNDRHIVVAGETLHFLDVKKQTLNGEQTFRIIDKNFVANKVYKKYAATSQMECVKTGVMQSCCPGKNAGGLRIYHVTV